MSETMKILLARRSIRKYKEEPVSDEIIRECLRAAMSAPSAHNQQPWQFVVIRERKTLLEITRFHRWAAMLKEAPVAILVCADQTRFKSASGFWVQDCAAATQNILLAATAYGLGSVWLGVYPNRSVVEPLSALLELPGNVIPFSLVALGYPAEKKPPSHRYDPQRIHLEKWSPKSENG